MNNSPKAIYKPGELEETRKHLGEISKEESLRVAKLLGGEVGVEQTPLFDNFRNSSRASYNKNARQTAQNYTRKPSRTSFNEKREHPEKNSSFSSSSITPKAKKTVKNTSNIPEIDSKTRSKFDKLMAQSEYRIKKLPSIFTIIFTLGKVPDKVSEEFVTIILMNYVAHMQHFFSSVKSMSKCAGNVYLSKINESQAPKFRFLRYCCSYNMENLRDLQRSYAMHPNEITISAMVPFIKEIFKPLLTLFFLGEQGVPELIKTSFSDMTDGLKLKQEENIRFVREACAEWSYIYNNVIKGLYPLLMRMVHTEVLPFARFFNKNMPKILTFLGMTKFDLILPEKNQDSETYSQDKEVVSKVENQEETQKTEDSSPQKEEDEKDNNGEIENEDSRSNSDSVFFSADVKQGIDLLEKLFPEAGWEKAGRGADFYPYFQNIYSFVDGFNLLSEKNPMQLTIVLHRILEDLFQGCRNMKFTIDKNPDFASYKDSLADVFSEWSLYRESLFERDYLTELKKIVNSSYSQPDFLKTPYARKQMSRMLWQAKIMFLPNLNYEFFFMERTVREEIEKSLPARVDFLKDCFSNLIAEVESQGIELLKGENSSDHKKEEAIGCSNILSIYRFDVKNPTSERVTSLLGGPKSTKTTNLNLLKYTLSILNVLDWWISDKDSPAYESNAKVPFRTNPEDGSLIFSVPLRTDQLKLFNKAKKERMEKRAEEQQSSSGNNPSD